MMGLFSGLLGNASQKDIEKTERQLEDILTTTENVELAFSLIRDLIVFTDSVNLGRQAGNDWQKDFL